MIIAVGLNQKELEKLAEIDEVRCVSGADLDVKLEDFILNPRSAHCERLDGSKIVIMHDVPRENLGTLMRSVRKVLDGHVIFATSTPTSLKWTIRNLIAELEAEDEYFRKN